MGDIFSSIESFLLALSSVMPLEAFVFFGSLVEELVSPIPSTLIMGTAGSVASASNHAIFFLFWLSLVGNLGKILGSIFYYLLGDKLEGVIARKFGKYLGVTHEQIESIGKRFSGHWRDGITLFVFRVLPFVPTTPVSLACGVIRMPMRTFLMATFLGNFIKDFFYLLIGYMGFVAIRDLFHSVMGIKYYVDIAFGIAFVGLLFLLWYHRKKGVWIWEQLRNTLKTKMTNTESSSKPKDGI